MHDLRDELAGLVADVSSALDALRLQGVLVLPRAPASLPRIADPEPLARAENPQVHTQPPAPRPRGASSVLPLRAEAPRSDSAHPPPPIAEPPAPAPAGGGGLLGRWAEQLIGPDERLAKVVESLGAACNECGEPPVVGVGAIRSGLALCADACSEAETNVLANMLLKVVGVEPSDVWTAAPRRCPGCIAGLRRQIEAIKPRVLLVLGPTAVAATGLARGEWGSFAGLAAIATWHPSELAADVARKRPTFDVLQQVAKRR
ncbi:hypothetical protein LBMAG42_30420 [Deltaproteobacteria bacterium]|nr:hypothetical protein LBMAG42_30420 [Deltaproteobacteria bacterium]